MYPPGSFGNPVPSFPFPVDPPVTKPGDDPTFQICVNKDWLPFIAGAMKQLLLQSTWNYSTDADLLDIQGRVFDLISKFGPVNEGCGVITPNKLCITASFPDGDYEFTPSLDIDCATTYIPGTGWQSCDDTILGADIAQIKREFGGTTRIRDFSAVFSGPALLSYDTKVELFLGGTSVFAQSFTVTLGGTGTNAASPDVDADSIVLTVSKPGAVTFGNYYITDIGLCYTGLFPLAERIWTHVFDFLAEDGGFVGSIAGLTSGSPGAWFSGSGWVDGDAEYSANNWYRLVFIYRTFAARITGIVLKYDRSGMGTDGPHSNPFTVVRNGSNTVTLLSQDFDHSEQGTDLQLTWSGDYNTNGLTLLIISSYFGGSTPTYSGSVTLKSLTISGRGADPFA